MPHKLLLADDSVTIQRVIELTFADEDVQVIVVGDGRQAIERLQRDRPDIVLADIGMPERDGYEVAAFAKGNPELAHIPVVLLTGAFEPIDENRARSVGCDGVLVKPFEPQMVINRVKELLARPRPAAPVPAPAPVQASVAPAPVAAPAARGPLPLSRLDSDLAPPPAAAERPQSEGESLEDYFDRLDAAFANLGAVPAPQAPAVPHEDLRTELRELHEPPPEPAPAPGPAPAPELARAPEPARAFEPAQSPDPARAPEPERAFEPAREFEPAPVSVDVAADWDADLPGDFAPARQPHLATAFAALLAAEEGQPLSQAALMAPPPAIAEDTIEEVVNRVIARMGDESVRQLVIETAERVVREEIERIKRMTATADEPRGA